jgi:energy-coupling factor transport system ATP-binding protein
MMSVRIENLSHFYQRGTPFERAALRNITLDIPTGACIGIAGRSGSGKTTLIQHLNGLLKPATGAIAVNGIDVARWDLKELRRRVGIVFQYPEHQIFEETVYREIAFGLKGSGLTAQESDLRVREVLHVVGLGGEILEKSPFALSGGEKRRVAIAGVLVMSPEILVLDEPAAGLDPQGCRIILDLLARLHRETGITLVLVSHAMDHLVRLADRLIILKEGAIALEGKTREVFRDAEALESIGVAVPQITRFMMKLKKALPELRGDILTVEEARAELNRVLPRRPKWNGLNDEQFIHGPVLPGQVDLAPVGPPDQNSPDLAFCGGYLSR